MYNICMSEKENQEEKRKSCHGSFRTGKACADCPRCEAKGFTSKDRDKARAAAPCSGSYRAGTACAKCPRCKARGFTLEDRARALKAEVDRTKGFPTNRVKPKHPHNDRA